LERLFTSLAILAATLVSAQSTRGAIMIDKVPVGNAGNAGDVQVGGPFGAVAYDYRIGRHEVTNSQYAAFLNAVADTDTFGLYNANMGTNARGGISQSGASGSFTYATKLNMDNKPVNFVSWYDAVRFTNWLHNGQPNGPQGNGTTETGAYTLLGGTTVPSNALTIARQPGALWFLPSEHEWYKAAYHKNDGATGNYWDHATGLDAPAPTVATANAVGDISNPGANVANHNNGADWNSQNGNVTTVGSAGIMSAGPYFTYDQAGNVFEFTEALNGTSRVIRGGSYNLNSTSLLASSRGTAFPTSEAPNLGFRIGTHVPEPSSIALLAAVTVIAALHRRFRFA
jgi:formylglycine-generating enzyme required for sulfatase activity